MGVRGLPLYGGSETMIDLPFATFNNGDRAATIHLSHLLYVNQLLFVMKKSKNFFVPFESKFVGVRL